MRGLLRRDLVDKKIILSCILAAALVSSLIAAALVPMQNGLANAGASMSVMPDVQSVDIGDTITVSAYIWSDESTMSSQAGLRFTPGVLQCNSVTNGGYYTGGLQTPTDPNIDNDNGTVEVTMIGLLGATQDPGEGDFLIYEFTALQNGIATLELIDVIISDVANEAIEGITVNSGQITVGEVMTVSDLIISEKSETWIEEGISYEVSYTVINQGAGDADASVTEIDADGQIMTDDVPTLAAGELHSATVGPFDFSDPSDTITVTADSTAVIDEEFEDNNSLQNELDAPVSIEKPDLIISEKSETWIEEGISYEVSYTVINQGAGDADASVTEID
ncbi:MAG: CARDB domain-containing protein, partial [Chloroflexota bacterium]|nr:CARDB domain-containing protein [Chloroflexota bacterium]